jgi:hypothetical protein
MSKINKEKTEYKVDIGQPESYLDYKACSLFMSYKQNNKSYGSYKGHLFIKPKNYKGESNIGLDKYKIELWHGYLSTQELAALNFVVTNFVMNREGM